VLSGHDEFTQIAEEFNDLVGRLQETEGARRRFVSDASHELKTPLASIRLLTDSILQNENIDPATARDFVSDIGQEADRLSHITEDLLRLTRLDSGELEEPSLVEVRPVAERVSRLLEPVAREKEVSLHLSVPAGVSVVSTPGEVHQVLYNLMENAVKYNRRGGSVWVSAQPGEETTTITVTDNGIGIPPEELTQVFKRFYRVDKARSRAAGGTGLGLAIVQDTVSRRGGLVRAEAVESGGARFVVTLPCVREEASPCES
jgi:signal transduction histidine kinase